MTLTAYERVMRRVNTAGPGGCWLWTGHVSPTGYGSVRATNKIEDGMVYVHVAAYKQAHGEVPVGLDVDHTCHSAAVAEGLCEGGPRCLHRRCVNPAHLEAVSRRENLRRSNNVVALNMTKTECAHGHAFSGSNLIQNKNGSRACRTCKNGQRRGQVSSDSVLRQSVHAEGA